MLKTKILSHKLFNQGNQTQVQLTFNSNDDLNILLGENSKNIDKLNEIIDVEISFFGNKLLIVGEKQNVELTENLINKVYDILLFNKNTNRSIDFGRNPFIKDRIFWVKNGDQVLYMFYQKEKISETG